MIRAGIRSLPCASTTSCSAESPSIERRGLRGGAATELPSLERRGLRGGAAARVVGVRLAVPSSFLSPGRTKRVRQAVPLQPAGVSLTCPIEPSGRISTAPESSTWLAESKVSTRALRMIIMCVATCSGGLRPPAGVSTLFCDVAGRFAYILSRRITHGGAHEDSRAKHLGLRRLDAALVSIAPRHSKAASSRRSPRCFAHRYRHWKIETS